MRRIVCIGNRYVREDAAGARVHERLARAPLPAGVELIDGGLGGLDLARHADGAERLVFVDATSGLGAAGEVRELDPAAVARHARAHDHAAGLPYLLRALPAACEGPLPEIRVVGLEGVADEDAVGRAAALALRLAVEGEA